jgi:hypothetical protein
MKTGKAFYWGGDMAFGLGFVTSVIPVSFWVLDGCYGLPQHNILGRRLIGLRNMKMILKYGLGVSE